MIHLFDIALNHLIFFGLIPLQIQTRAPLVLHDYRRRVDGTVGLYGFIYISEEFTGEFVTRYGRVGLAIGAWTSFPVKCIAHDAGSKDDLRSDIDAECRRSS